MDRTGANLRIPRRTVLIVCSTALPAALPFVVHHWYFQEVDHQRVVSPDGQWVVVVTKQMHNFPEPVDVRLKVFENLGAGRLVLDIGIDGPDCWQDVEPDSYRIEWLTATEFRVGGRYADEDVWNSWKYDGGQWR